MNSKVLFDIIVQLFKFFLIIEKVIIHFLIIGTNKVDLNIDILIINYS
jgi:hypothetical protein